METFFYWFGIVFSALMFMRLLRRIRLSKCSRKGHKYRYSTSFNLYQCRRCGKHKRFLSEDDEEHY